MASIHVSEGNTKLGRIPSVSLPPIKTCPDYVECTDKCYALKFYKMYPSCYVAWNENYQFWLESPQKFVDSIRNYLKSRKSPYFRWHVSGDALSAEYMRAMVSIAESLTGTAFLAYTKTEYWKSMHIPDNLSLILSRWPGDGFGEVKGIPQSYVEMLGEDRIPGHHVKCRRSCDKCFACWYLAEDEAVVFPLH